MKEFQEPAREHIDCKQVEHIYADVSTERWREGGLAGERDGGRAGGMSALTGA